MPATATRTSSRRKSRRTESPLFVQPDSDPGPESDTRTLLMSMDYGTKTLSLAYRIANPGEEASPSKVWDVHFSEKDYFAPQKAAWSKHGDFFWGYGLERALKRKQIQPDEVIELWKLLLYKSYQTEPVAEAVREQLGDRDVEELLTTHLQEVMKEAKAEIKKDQCLEFSAKDIDDLPMQLFLSVPQMWQAPANRIMTDAAKLAGIEYVELVYEPQCAAAYYTHSIKDRIPKQLNVGDILLIADIGGGTGDFVSYEYKQNSDAGATVGLQVIGTPQGKLCGSEFVNQEFQKWLNCQPEFKTKCQQLGLTAKSCLRQASAAFEDVKLSFSEPTEDSEFVTIRGKASWDIELTSANIVCFFDPVIRRIVEGIEEQLMPNTKVLIIPGGFGQSEYLVETLRARYNDKLKILGQANSAVGASQPVSRGALLRYKDIKTRGIPMNEAFGVGSVEEYDMDLHPDATLHPDAEDRLPSGQKCKERTKREDIVLKDKYDNRDIVYERWLPILRKGTPCIPGQPVKAVIEQEHVVELDQTTISVQIYWTKGDIGQHEAIYKGATAEDEIRDDVEPWGAPLEMEIPNLAQLGFELKEGDVYEVRWFLTLTCDGANVEASWQILKPGTQPWDAEGRPRYSIPEFVADKAFVVCEGRFNPFPRTAV